MLVDENSFQGIVANRLGEAGLNIIMNIPGTGEELGRTTVSSTKATSEGVDKMLTGIATTQRRWAGNWKAACKNVELKPFPSPVFSTSTPK